MKKKSLMTVSKLFENKFSELFFLEAAENRRELIRRRNLEREKQEAEVLPLDDDLPDVPADDESSEYETEYESEEDEGPRLKPVFVREKGTKKKKSRSSLIFLFQIDSL